ncbi:unnamed protein product [Sphagnum balticum]
MSDIHRRVVRRALLQAGHLGVDPEKARRGLLGFRNRRKRGYTKAASGGEEEEDLPVPSAAPSSKRRRTSDFGVEETIDDGSRSPVKRSSAPSKLPPKFAVLKAFYEGLEAAVSLLAIRCQRCTFESVCSTVEATTQRRFLHQHLAQIKHILPEAVHLEYVRSWDSELQRSKWDLSISLLPMPSPAEKDEEESELQSSELISSVKKQPKISSVERRKAFHRRLQEFANTHPEQDDVPEDPLPERLFKAGGAAATGSSSGNSKVLEISQGFTSQPGSMPEKDVRCHQRHAEDNAVDFEMSPATTCIPLEINTAPHRHALIPPKSEISVKTTGHFARSFRPQFSSKALNLANCVGLISSSNSQNRDIVSRDPAKLSHFSQSFKPHFSSRSVMEAHAVQSGDTVYPNVSNASQNASSFLLSTPMKPSVEESHAHRSGIVNNFSPCTPLCSQPIAMSTDPSKTLLSSANSSPSRCPDAVATPVKKTATMRSLTFKTPVKIPSKSPLSTRGLSDSKSNSSIADDYDAHKQHEVPCNSSITGDAAAQEQEIPLSSEMESVSDADMNMIQCLPAELVHLVMEEEKKASEERSNGTLKQRRQQLMLSGLPQLFNQLRLIFQSCNRTVIPHNELISKVLSSNPETTDQGEVEERLKLLLEAAPEWITVKPSLAGDNLYRISKSVDVVVVHKRLCSTQ